MITILSRERWIPWLLFAATFVAFAYFHQGGGWNQNVRFAMVRAMVEEGTFSIDSYLVYTASPSDRGPRLVRVPVQNAEFTYEGRNYAFQWRDTEGRMVPLNGSAAGAALNKGRDMTYVEPEQVAVSGDVSYYRGHFHPNKAPGGAFVAVPVYFILYKVEQLLGADPDEWWTLTLNSWLTSVFSVGVLSALGCVVLYRFALKLSGGHSLESLLAALAFAFGTLYFSYGTTLYEHNIIAVALLASCYLLYQVKESLLPSSNCLSDKRARLLVYLAGLCAGYAAITNYIMAIVVVFLGCYLLFAMRLKAGWLWFGLGVLGPFMLICAYNVACFSTPFTTNYSHENPLFETGRGALMGLFFWPQGEVVAALLISPFRGLFISSPVLLLGVYGLTILTSHNKTKAMAWLFFVIVVYFFVFISAMRDWHGGWAVGPRYLVPVLPLLALPAVYGFQRIFKTACVLGVLSISMNLLVTAVDPQAPVGNVRQATVEGRPQWLQNPITDYLLPLFFEGRPGPLLRAQRDQALQFYDRTMQVEGEQASARAQRLDQLKDEIDGNIRSGEPAPLLPERGPDGRMGLARSDLSTITGPVSANPMGFYEGWMYRAFPAHSEQARWNSFNAGEFLFERSRWSLAPLLLFAGALVAVMIRLAARPGGRQQVEGHNTQQGSGNS